MMKNLCGVCFRGYWKTNFINNNNKKRPSGQKNTNKMSCKSCTNSTNVVSPSDHNDISTIIPNGSHNTVNTDIISNNSITGIMNDDNRKVMLIAAEKGVDEAVKHMFNPTGEKQLSYAEMRERYG